MSQVAMMIKITTVASHRDEFVAGALAGAAVARDFDGCLAYHVHLAADDPDVLWTYSVFANSSAPQRLAASEELAPIVERLTPLIAAREVVLLTPVDVASGVA